MEVSCLVSAASPRAESQEAGFLDPNAMPHRVIFLSGPQFPHSVGNL